MIFIVVFNISLAILAKDQNAFFGDYFRYQVQFVNIKWCVDLIDEQGYRFFTLVVFRFQGELDML